MKQRKYNEGFSTDLFNRLEAGVTTDAYFDKKKFSFAKNFEEFAEELEFDVISNTKLQEILQADSDFERGRLVYEAFSFLTRREASDIDFWNYLAHNQLYPLVHKMWPEIDNPPNNSSPMSYVKNHWVMTKSSQAELMDYPLSGLWWSFFMTVDEGRTDKYELTKIFFKNLSFRTKSFGQSKIARHRDAVLAVLEFIQENGLHERNFEDNGLAIVPYLNLLGGIRPLGFFDKDWFKSKLSAKFSQDITTHGRLFHRRERPTEAMQVICVLKNEIEKREKIQAGVAFQVSVNLELPDHSLFIVLKNGFVKKINGDVLQPLDVNKSEKMRGIDEPISSVFYAKSDSLLLVCFKNQRDKKCLKLYKGAEIPGHSLHSNLKSVVKSPKEWKVIPLPQTFEGDVSSLINAEVFLEGESKKEAIALLKPLITEYSMFT
jgi:hypothetical protein